MNTAARPFEILRDVFGYTAFRGCQADIINHVIAGGSALVLMPTGGGKSLCYQIPALILPGVAIIVSPLISLMQNQVSALQELGVAADCLNSATIDTDVQHILQRLHQGALDLLYVSPERLLMPHFMQRMDSLNIALFAIDEAHCVSQWGHFFRPEYQQLAVLAQRYPNVPRLALTATADQQTRQDILYYLRLTDAKHFITSFDRPNLFYQVLEKDNAKKQLLDFIRNGFMGVSGIVYCLSRKRVDTIVAWLCEHGIDALPYHAGLTHDVREVNQQMFLRNDNMVMVATIAFGMGIDKPDIRFVAHIDMPKSLENFYQESGRAGRDGLPSTSWLCYGLNDFIQLKCMIVASQISKKAMATELEKLDAMFNFCEQINCRRQHMLRYFDEESEPCGYCDNCVNPPQTYDASLLAQKLMSCIYRTKQRFAAQHIIDVLRGKASDTVRSNRHNTLSTYRIGADTSERKWRSVTRQLIAQRLIAVDVTDFQALRLVEKSRSVLKGEQTVVLRSVMMAQDWQKLRQGGQWLRSERQERLWQALRTWRATIASKHHVPTYVVFPDRTFRELVEQTPTNAEELAKIYGLGKTKLVHYGEALLAIIKSIAV